MNVEEKILGYPKKKTFALIGAVVIASVFFYAGTKFEKGKLSSLGLLKNSSDSSATVAPGTTKAVKATKPNVNAATTSNSQSSTNVQGNVNAQVNPSPQNNAGGVAN